MENYILTLLFGLIIGSFLNVCIYRLPRKESIVFGRSHCTNCSTMIKWYDLVPVFSYIFLRGKCRNCKVKISIQYPMVELVNGLAYLGLYWLLGYSILFYILCVVVSSLIVSVGIWINKLKFDDCKE